MSWWLLPVSLFSSMLILELSVCSRPERRDGAVVRREAAHPLHADGPSAPIFFSGRGSIFPARVITGNGVALIGVHFLVCCMSPNVYYFPVISRSPWRCVHSGGADVVWDVASAGQGATHPLPRPACPGGGVSGKPNLHHSVSPSLLHSSPSPGPASFPQYFLTFPASSFPASFLSHPVSIHQSVSRS